MDPGRRKSGTSTAHSVSEAVKESTTELLQQLHNEGVSTKRKQESLKALVRMYLTCSCHIFFIALASSYSNVTENPAS